MTASSTSLFDSSFVIADTSARLRARSGIVVAQWQRAVSARQITTCPVVKLELFHTARDANAVEAIEVEERAFRSIPITRSVQNAAIGAVRELARRGGGYHRVSLPDVLIAAAAQDVGADVLHYDRHFDRLAEVLHFRSIWLAPAGSLS
ncbi:PIN domain-containing protein [Conexibacter woesei]|uniref:Ribonuclease VapC n=1 Tax=Conexibacter woesei (strain DSM 14684 / CCUG 47730 / CIP 108061 / JCM 11494 / NBRC 100937 / ID131577) TaxID=469383 RepID=D3F1L4_CONWI|nr:PIN domain-containing protein [Conexibacter woesei]ADB52177.1 PilT protein domain protein [Conexibacter woesei DSM 14684]